MPVGKAVLAVTCTTLLGAASAVPLSSRNGGREIADRAHDARTACGLGTCPPTGLIVTEVAKGCCLSPGCESAATTTNLASGRWPPKEPWYDRRRPPEISTYPEPLWDTAPKTSVAGSQTRPGQGQPQLPFQRPGTQQSRNQNIRRSCIGPGGRPPAQTGHQPSWP
jgi:hypothetical protein